MASKRSAKKGILALCSCIIALPCIAQSSAVKEINRINPPSVALSPLRFLASDELMGRSALRPEINIAALYISEQFRSMGIREVPGAPDYFQLFDIKTTIPSTKVSFVVNGKDFELATDMLKLDGDDIQVSAPVVYAGFGLKADFDKLDVKGKIVITTLGTSDSSRLHEGFDAMEGKVKLAKEKGAVALIELFKKNDPAWDRFTRRFTDKEERVKMEDFDFPLFLLRDKNIDFPALIKGLPADGVLSTSGGHERPIPAKNVMGWVEGTDVRLKKQFIVLTAHYDHLGVAKQPKLEEGKMDSIYNGARDNAAGTAAVLDAARYFALHPPKRSVLFIVYTAEEIGEKGSQYFSEHPTIPLRELVYNLNTDNASYNDTTIISVIGLGRTSADDDIKKGCAAYGLTALPDPAPKEGLFDRSDNANLAQKGVPAPTFSLGIKQFDQSITNRYHQLSDEVGNFDLNYAMKYIYSFILSAKYIADDERQPHWAKSDKYETAWENLYGAAN
jgi:hypothetical protein